MTSKHKMCGCNMISLKEKYGKIDVKCVKSRVTEFMSHGQILN